MFELVFQQSVLFFVGGEVVSVLVDSGEDSTVGASAGSGLFE